MQYLLDNNWTLLAEKSAILYALKPEGSFSFEERDIVEISTEATPVKGQGMTLKSGASYKISANQIYARAYNGTATLNVLQVNTAGGGGEYVLPPATKTTLGGVIIGNGLDITATGVISANTVPFDSMKYIKDYLYEVTYSKNFDEANATTFFENINDSGGFSGGCTAVRNGNLLGRNLDWLYDNDCVFVVRSQKTANRLASIGTAATAKLTEEQVESGEYDKKYSVLPYFTVDGINENGVWCATLVAPSDFGTTNQSTGKTKACVMMLPRILLDKAHNLTEADSLINSYDWFVATGHNELHFLYGDGTTTKLVEFINNVTTITTPTAPILTNFHKHNVTYETNGHVVWSSVEAHGNGLERYDIAVDGQSLMTDVTNAMTIMRSLNYTQTYSKDFDDMDFWVTEYCGNTPEFGNLTITTPKADFSSIVTYTQNLYAQHQRNGSYWQSATNCVYDIANRKLYLLTDEEDIANIKEFCLDATVDQVVTRAINNLRNEILNMDILLAR